MKRLVIMSIMALLGLWAVGVTAADTKVEAPDSCEVCGMSRPAFAKTRMLITFEDGKTFGTCSIACASDVVADKDKKVKSIQVGDYTTKKLIDAKSATWVIDSGKRGVMSPVAKWAFAKKEDATAYVKQSKKNSAKLATWDEALAAACAERQGDDAKKGGCDCCSKEKK